MTKDWNYVAKLEKAIEEKYGPQATINPASKWTEEDERKYKEQRREKYTKDKKKEKEILDEGRDFDIRKNRKTEQNRICSVKVCSKYSFSIKDDVYMNKYGCCFDCYIKFIEGREEFWEEKKKSLIIEKEEK